MIDTIETMERAMSAFQRGRDDEAAALCEQVVAAESDNPDAQYVLGMIAYRRKELESAESHLRRAIEFEREAYWFHAGLAEVLIARQKPEQAAEALRVASQLAPDSPEIANAVAVMIQQFGAPADQVQAWQRAVQLAPNNAAALAALGKALVLSNKASEAIPVYRKALEIDANLFEAHHGLAAALNIAKQPDEAAEHARRAIALRPNDAQGHHALAVAHWGLRRYDESIESLRRAVELDPNFKDARDRLAVLLASTGDLEGAIQAWQDVLKIYPHDQPAHSNVLMSLNYMPQLSPQQVFDAHQRWGQTYAEPFREYVRPHSNTPEAHRRLRIGYISPDFYRHPVAQFVRNIFAAHHQDKYEVVGLSDVPRPDAMTHELQRLAGKWIPIVGKGANQIAELVRFEGIDVLIDLTGHTGRHRLGVFAMRAAPVQISYLGYCNTTGMTAMDWIVGDEITDPAADTQPYAEKVMRLPGCFCCWSAPSDAPEVNELPASTGRPLTIGAFHALRKLNDGVIDLWSRLLRELPDARLLVWRTYLSPRVEARLREAFASRGVGGERLEFRAHRPESGSFLSVYHDVDLALDAFPWSGHTTSCDALWMGVPMVTLRGRTHCGRMAASTLTAAGFGRFVADTEEDYIRIAKELAGDIPALAELRRTMRATTAASALCDGPRFIVGWERAIREAWKAWCQAKRTRME